MIRYLADVLSFTQRIYSAQIFFCGHYQLPMISIYLSWWGHIWVMAQTGKRRGGGNRKHHCGRIGMLPPFFTALLLQASSFNSVQVICWSPCTGRERGLVGHNCEHGWTLAWVNQPLQCHLAENTRLHHGGRAHTWFMRSKCTGLPEIFGAGGRVQGSSFFSLKN